MINYITILLNGGATVDKQGKAHTLKSGYQVSKQDVAVIAVKNFTQAQVEELCNMVGGRGNYAGFWVDGGFVYCDLSKRYGTKKDALAAGRAYNQKSIFDWKKQTCIWC